MTDPDTSPSSSAPHPRDRFITVYGRKPVLEAVNDRALQVDKVLVARTARGPIIAEILRKARSRGIPCRRADPRDVSRLSKNARQDQGVAADVLAPEMEPAEAFFERISTSGGVQLIALDGITTPANVGMILRSAAAAGVDGVILPRHSTSSLNPLLIKASAGLVFKTHLLRCHRLEDALVAARSRDIHIVGLDGRATGSLFDAALPDRAVYVLGNESEGLSGATTALTTLCVRIPMAAGVDSINVACAATLLCFEVSGRRRVLGAGLTKPEREPA